MSAPQYDAETALLDAVAALAATLDPVMVVAWPDSDANFDPPPEGYLRVSHLPQPNQRLFLEGEAESWRTGMLQVDVMLPYGGGARPATALAAQVAAAFDPAVKLRSGSVVLAIQRAPDLAQALRSGSFWQVPVTVRYEYSG